MTDRPLVFPTSPAHSSPRNVFAVASGKGGVGKTWLSITLAHALARTGRKAVLFDGDLGLANVDIQLGLMPAHDLGAVVDGAVPLSAAVEHYEDGGFDIIAGRSGSGSLANLTPARLNELRRDLLSVAERYDAMVIDLGAGVDRTVRSLAGIATTTLVVTTDEPTSLTDAYAFIKVMRAANPQADLRVVVNMATSARDAQRTYATLSKASRNFLNFAPPLAGIVRRDPRVRDAIRNQVPLLMRSPGTTAAEDIEAIARGLLAPQPAG